MGVKNSKKWEYLKLELEQACSDYRYYDNKIKNHVTMMIGAWIAFITPFGLIHDSITEEVLFLTFIALVLTLILLILLMVTQDLKKSVKNLENAYLSINKLKKHICPKNIPKYEISAPYGVITQFSWLNYIAFAVGSFLWAGVSLLYFVSYMADGSIRNVLFFILSFFMAAMIMYLSKKCYDEYAEILNIFKKYDKEI
ncbi:preprotein translocase subunit SecG [Methanococcus maripaludis]|uniref:Preprotein translocase subunit SecG n=1 Tax=Methanococcus maripaludis TaxID=39152 RepID=A0A7J9NV81_METMI|nr:hypothetical protein [Methanococcus maripaludis]MBA2851217.1 preprotein translocase subunit SecG [Methanococcus maripaludis]